ncbi:hypothetical protein C1D09_007065 [Mesorhizobium intechi]|uniref:DUF2231 domain-containing protein n=1 Tax=Mesorhizobium intechi TaxID=537601 RepID=A0A8T9AUS7_9HYPH|nr:DUF2231 domain-containing protein [Mesorhizobium intechi]TSE12844.1 hypothetical protein C1D09_007065 [Mesorhizobium intechi]
MVPIQHIHPIFVHFPIVIILTVTLVDIVGFWRRHDMTVRSGAGTISTGLAVAAGLFAVATWYLGGLALDFAESGGFSSPVAETHEGLGGVTALAFLIWGALRLGLWVRNRGIGSMAVAIPAIEIAGSALVTITAYYGGILVYDLGVNVAKVTVGG